MMNDSTAKLIEEIEIAFLKVEKPRITLRVARGMDDNRYDELAKLERLDGGYTDWRDIPDEDITRYDVFIWLCPIGFRFYLPAFMSHSLKTSKRLADDAWLGGAFSKTCLKSENLDFLNMQQKRAALHFIEAVLASIPDDYHKDWWNHPWDPEWDADREKVWIWDEVGEAFEQLKRTVPDP